MKRIVYIILLTLASTGLMAQKSKTDICLERGHLWGHYQYLSYRYCPDYIVDLDSVSLRVYPCCNQMERTCERCKKIEFEKCPNDTIIVWKKSIK